MRNIVFALFLLFSSTSFSQDYPARAVRVLVGYPPGGGMDTIARVLAPKLGEALGQQFVVENRPGASGGVAAEALAGAQPDGHVLMLAESGTLALPSVNPKVTLDPVRQFAPVGGVCMLPMAFVVTAAFPAASTSELIAVLKADPGKYNYASPGVGTLQHLAFELFKRQAGVNALHVPYKGAAAMMPDIMSGQVPIGVISAIAAAGPTRAGKIRTLAVTSPRRLPSAPDWPAMAETLPGFSAAPNVFFVAPAGTPQAVVLKLNGAIRGALGSREVEENFAKQGATATPSTPEELRAQIAEELKRWAALVKDAGIRLE
ncbi:MAG TPA: tripartite tricarboxylate transporter substrate-binding protein [Burkholderiales bacterium]|nr:tripartite tricarboxylate transporter substrate-binding protein [Burkholderiales bacterium]